jgi:hypothetical protein
MRKNTHEIERFIRFFGGAFLVSLSFWGVKNPWFLLGIVPMLTGLTGVCPLYSMMSISTRNQDKEIDTKGHRYFHSLAR